MQVRLCIPVTENFIHGETSNIGLYRAWLFPWSFLHTNSCLFMAREILSGVKFIYLFIKAIALTSEGRGHPTGLPDQQPVQARIWHSRFLVSAHVSVHTSVCCVPLTSVALRICKLALNISDQVSIGKCMLLSVELSFYVEQRSCCRKGPHASCSQRKLLHEWEFLRGHATMLVKPFQSSIDMVNI